MVKVDVTATNTEVDEFFNLCKFLLCEKVAGEMAINRQQRYGQYVFNTMNDHYPDLANFFQGALIDPFYAKGPAARDKVEKFVTACQERFMAIYDVEG
jgi:hypothetical protein